MVQFRFRVVRSTGIAPLAETPRSDVIKVVLCLQAKRKGSLVRQSARSHSRFPPQVRPELRITIQNP